MKFRILAITAAALLSSQAHAISPAQVQAATTLKVYAAGASAIRNIVGGVFVANCATGTLDVYYSGFGAGTDFGSDAANGDSHRVYACTLKPDAQLETDLKGKGLGGKNIAFFKRDAGGSAQGVFPLAINSNIANLLIDATTCASTGATAAATTPSYICTKAENVRAPELGFSDVEPAFFKGINTPTGFSAAGLTSTQLASLTIVPTFQTVMAPAVSATLYTALQAAQNTTGMPSIPRSVFGSLLRGELASPADGLGWHALGVADADTQQVNICRRGAGSGTQAAANLLASGFPCNKSVVSSPAVNGTSEPAQPNALTGVSYTGGSLFVYEGGSTGNVASCLNNANDAGAYAIGHISRDNAEGTKWKFIALDGVAPTRDNLKAGLYEYAVESTAQYRKALITALNAGNADDKAKSGFITGFAKAVGRPVNMAKLSSTAQAGLAALPTQGVYLNAGNADEFKFVSRVGRNGDNCQPYAVQQ